MDALLCLVDWRFADHTRFFCSSAIPRYHFLGFPTDCLEGGRSLPEAVVFMSEVQVYMCGNLQTHPGSHSAQQPKAEYIVCGSILSRLW